MSAQTRPGRYARSFPTRSGRGAGLAEVLAAGSVYRMIVGVDARPRVLTPTDVDGLGDPFAVGVLRRGTFPMTARALLAALEALPVPGALPARRVFMVGDGGQIPFAEAPTLDRQLRFAITYGTPNQVELMVSTGTALDSDEVFLQLLAWDPRKRAYNYYLRERPAWVWSGDSEHALTAPSRGRGPFDSHVNGSLVMKELKAPWSNWHSMSAAIEVSIAADDPLRAEPLFQARVGAQELEQFVVRPGIARWNQARLERDVDATGAVRNATGLLRQVLETTSVNLISTDAQSALVGDGDRLLLPLTFFFDSDTLLDHVGLAPDIARPGIAGAAYRRALATFEVALTDGEGFVRRGDTHFAFLVPERAFEDVDIVAKLLDRAVLSRRLVASLLMVDFTNPLHSERRAALMRYVPDRFTPNVATPDLGTALALAIVTAAPATPDGSPEREAAANLAVDDWEAVFAARIERYLAALQSRLDSDGGFDDVFRLAESRRRDLRALPIAEFSLTTPICNISPNASRLRMQADASLAIKPANAPPRGGLPMKITRFAAPGLLDDLTEDHLAAWSDWISDTLDAAAAGQPDLLDNDGPRAQFFNPAKTEIADDAQTLEISWTAFPKVVASSAVSDLQRWRKADSSRDLQDEYCEWSVDRNDGDKITRVTFTCEGPEYWEFLASVSREKVVDLYRKFVDERVEQAHLFNAQGYNPRNHWNSSTSGGAMHLIQGANTLSAEIELAGGASVVRVINGKTLTDEQELIRCGKYGEPGRHSDPHIGERVNSLTRAHADVTLADPVGLYFGDLTTAGWGTPDGSDPKQYWKYVRGAEGRHMRAVYEVPTERGFVVGDITINGKPIRFGAQIADFITIKLVGVACRMGQSNVAPMTGCRARKVAPGLVEQTVAWALRPRSRTR